MSDDEKVIEIILEELRSIKNDVKRLLEFKNKFYGVVIFISFFVSVGGGAIIKYLP